jgi:hypothetical protein
MDIDSVMICIGPILERRFQLLSLRYPSLSAAGSGKHRAVEVALPRHKDSFMADDDIGVRTPYWSADKSIMKSRRHAAARRGQGNAKGNTNAMTERTLLAGKDKLTSTTLLSDQRGAVALEMPFVCLFMVTFLLLPLADLAIAGFQFVSAWEGLRAFGQSIQYSPPLDVTQASGWTSSALAKADPRFPIASFQIVCGDNKTDCSDASLLPKYYSYQTTVTLSPIMTLMRRVLCKSSNANSCSYTLSYSERFQ